MIPDLGKYAGDVLSAYAITFATLIILITASILRARRVKRRLLNAQMERQAQQTSDITTEAHDG